MLLLFLFSPLRGEILQNLIQNLTKSFCLILVSILLNFCSKSILILALWQYLRLNGYKNAGTPCGDVSADIILFGGIVRGLFCLPCLVDRFAAGVPEIDDVDDFTIDTVHHLVQAIDNNAAVGQRAVGIEWVNFTDVGHFAEHLGCLSYFLQETNLTLSSKLPADVGGYFCSTFLG